MLKPLASGCGHFVLSVFAALVPMMLVAELARKIVLNMLPVVAPNLAEAVAAQHESFYVGGAGPNAVLIALMGLLSIPLFYGRQ